MVKWIIVLFCHISYFVKLEFIDIDNIFLLFFFFHFPAHSRGSDLDNVYGLFQPKPCSKKISGKSSSVYNQGKTTDTPTNKPLEQTCNSMFAPNLRTSLCWEIHILFINRFENQVNTYLAIILPACLQVNLFPLRTNTSCSLIFHLGHQSCKFLQCMQLKEQSCQLQLQILWVCFETYHINKLQLSWDQATN